MTYISSVARHYTSGNKHSFKILCKLRVENAENKKEPPNP